MTAAAVEWLNILLRWAHVMFGILWIGTSFFFIWLEASLRKREGQGPGIAGESWMVHGGGFYLAEKYAVAPERMPPELHWFKYEAYFTLLTGLALLALIYYAGAEAFLIDRDKVALDHAWAIMLSAGSLAAGWFIYDAMVKSPLGERTGPLAVALFVEIAAFTFFYHGVFADRAAFLHVGALIGTIMATSVFAVIIPNQRKVVADLLAGRKPDPALGKQARQRSLHNNYLTLPVVFMMVSNHYPIVFSHPWSPLIALGIVLGGGLVRHYFNLADEGRLDWTAKAAVPAAAVLLIGLVALSGYRPGAASGGSAAAFADIHPIIETHCASCHSATPSNRDYPEAPKGVAFDTAEEIRRHARNIERQAVLSDIMPLGNATGMTEAERRLLGAWVEAGARGP
ncbi:MAG: urate hydroxylase PuuD [Pseudomonadota bacterium]|nr:urate hydroxylase PuuD [Pseudomonadota bacterium]